MFSTLPLSFNDNNKNITPELWVLLTDQCWMINNIFNTCYWNNAQNFIRHLSVIIDSRILMFYMTCLSRHTSKSLWIYAMGVSYNVKFLFCWKFSNLWMNSTSHSFNRFLMQCSSIQKSIIKVHFYFHRAMVTKLRSIAWNQKLK